MGFIKVHEDLVIDEEHIVGIQTTSEELWTLTLIMDGDNIEVATFYSREEMIDFKNGLMLQLIKEPENDLDRWLFEQSKKPPLPYPTIPTHPQYPYNPPFVISSPGNISINAVADHAIQVSADSKQFQYEIDEILETMKDMSTTKTTKFTSALS